MTRPRAAVALLACLLAMAPLTACSSSGSAGGGGSGASSPDGSAGVSNGGGEGGAATVDPIRVARTGVKPTGETAAVQVGPRKGGTLTVTLPSGAVATLTYPPGAVDERTTMTMAPFVEGEMEGVILEPAGTWLLIPARLVFTSTTKTPVVRVGAATDGTVWFAAAPRDADGAVPIVRLRPVGLVDTGPGELPPPGVIVAGGQAAGGYDGPDPLDLLAAQEEAEETTEPGTDTGREEAEQQAGPRVTLLAPECGPDVPQAAAMALEAWRTAGSRGQPPVECVKLDAEVNASIQLEFKGSGLPPYQEVVGASGTGIAVDGVASLKMPAQRETSGFAQLVSYINTGFGSALAMGLGFDAPPPSQDTCTAGAIPQGSVTLDTVPLPSGKVRVTVEGRHGPYSLTCEGLGTNPVDLTVWDFLRDAFGLGAGEPITFTMTPGPNQYHVLDSLTSIDGRKVRHGADGSITLREQGVVIRATFGVGLRYSPAT